MNTITRLTLSVAACIAAAISPALAAAEEKAGAAPPAGNAVGADADWKAKVTPSGGAPGAAAPALTDAQTQLVAKVTAYFNKLDSLKGVFIQTGSDDKRMKGKFYVERPGRFRFDYNLPSKQVIISDGTYLQIVDLDLKNEDRMELDETPFRLVLRKDVDLVRDAKIIEVREDGDLLYLTVEDKDPDAPGRIALMFTTKPSVELKEWVTTDPQGLSTRVEVSDLVRGEKFDAELFKIKAVTVGRMP